MKLMTRYPVDLPGFYAINSEVLYVDLDKLGLDQVMNVLDSVLQSELDYEKEWNDLLDHKRPAGKNMLHRLSFFVQMRLGIEQYLFDTYGILQRPKADSDSGPEKHLNPGGVAQARKVVDRGV